MTKEFLENSFGHYKENKSVPEDIGAVLDDILTCGKTIYSALQRGFTGKAGSVNATGDRQVGMDVFSNTVLVETLQKNEYVGLIGSEELEEPLDLGRDGLSVVFDPLDGSSVVDLNLAVGTIVGIYGPGGFLGKTGREQIASIILVYGPQLTFTVTLSDTVDMFGYDPDEDDFFLKKENVRMPEGGKIWGCGNVAAIAKSNEYAKLFDEMVNKGYALRYSGGMVADVNQILLKGGLFSYPGSQEKPQGKLRLAYECAPLALLVQRAGGKAISPDQSILDIALESYHQRTPFFIGSRQEISLVEEAFRAS